MNQTEQLKIQAIGDRFIEEEVEKDQGFLHINFQGDQLRIVYTTKSDLLDIEYSINAFIRLLNKNDYIYTIYDYNRYGYCLRKCSLSENAHFFQKDNNDDLIHVTLAEMDLI